MDRQRFLWLAAAVLLLVFQANTAHAASSWQNDWSSGGETNGNEVTVWSTYTKGQVGAAAVENAVNNLGRKLSAKEMANLLYWNALWERLFAEPTCATRGDCDTRAVTDEVIAANTQITLRDIASFIPRTPTATSEPGEWTVVGLPTNFYLTAEQHVVAGTLLGLSSEVRFTPVSSRWEHSDGTVVSADTIGASWAALGLPEFSSTATSHTYLRAAAHTVYPSIDYRADYRINHGSWTGINGTVHVDAPPLRLQAYQAHTVLVDHTCAEHPAGPGC